MNDAELENLRMRVGSLEEGYDQIVKKLAECERLLAMYQQMFGDVSSAHRIIGERFDNHAEQIKLVNEKVIDLANTLIKFGEAVIKR